MIKVAKFGGSSLSDGRRIKQLADIVEADPAIQFVVVSAPGKRHTDDIKVTDLLISLYNEKQAHLDYTASLQAIIQRFRAIIDDLAMDEGLLSHFEDQLNHYLSLPLAASYLLDALKSCGEDFNAQLIASYLNQRGIESQYLSPQDAPILVTDRAGDAQVLEKSYDGLSQWKASLQVRVIPGFFGYTEDGKICTFSRGGSDVTGSIVARGIGADSYENYTDQPYIFTGHPEWVNHPKAVKQITYSEMRELSYAGFGIFHPEAVQPLLDVEIPIVIKSSSQPQQPGTQIVKDRKPSSVAAMPIVGVSGFSGYTMIRVKDYLLNRQVGYLRRMLSVFESHGISIEHIPTGIDYASVIIQSQQFQSQDQLNQILDDLQDELQADSIQVISDLSSIAVVGLGIENDTSAAHKSTGALFRAGIPIQTTLQGASELSMFYFVNDQDRDRAVQCIHDEFFHSSNLGS